MYQSGNNVNDVILRLQLSAEAETLFRSFNGNQMKRNTGKCHLIMSTNNFSEIHVGRSLKLKQIIMNVSRY